MKHRIKVDVVTEKRRLFGTRSVVRHKTITVTGEECCRIQRKKHGTAPVTEAERLAALYMIWEVELAKAYGEE